MCIQNSSKRKHFSENFYLLMHLQNLASPTTRVAAFNNELLRFIIETQFSYVIYIQQGISIYSTLVKFVTIHQPYNGKDLH